MIPPLALTETPSGLRGRLVTCTSRGRGFLWRGPAGARCARAAGRRGMLRHQILGDWRAGERREQLGRPAYLDLYESGELAERARRTQALLHRCVTCPRNCRVDRTAGELGVCRIGALAQVASYAPHFGEEAPLVGRGGSGTIFFAGCNLACVFCQNYDISQPTRHHSEWEADAGADRGDDVEPAGGRVREHQLRQPQPRGAADPRGGRAGRRTVGCGFPSSTTPAATTRCTRCGCSTA